jgi:hypothetical protein
MSQPVRIPDRFADVPPRRVRRLTKNAMLGRPDRRNDSGTAATNFRARAKAKRVRLRKLQRQARRSQRCHA